MGVQEQQRFSDDSLYCSIHGPFMPTSVGMALPSLGRDLGDSAMQLVSRAVNRFF